MAPPQAAETSDRYAPAYRRSTVRLRGWTVTPGPPELLPGPGSCRLARAPVLHLRPQPVLGSETSEVATDEESPDRQRDLEREPSGGCRERADTRQEER